MSAPSNNIAELIASIRLELLVFREGAIANRAG